MLRSYETSRLYREVKLRISLVRDNQLLLLPREMLYSCLGGVWNLSSEQGNLGFLFLTSVRLVWHASVAKNFNVSIPYVEIKDVKIRSSKFGPALVVITLHQDGGYVLGFRIDPNDRLNACLREINSLRTAFFANPQFGVMYDHDPGQLATRRSQANIPHEELTWFDLTDNLTNVPDVSYRADDCVKTDKAISFDPDLGLASK